MHIHKTHALIPIVGNITDRLEKNDNMCKGAEWLHFKIKAN